MRKTLLLAPAFLLLPAVASAAPTLDPVYDFVGAVDGIVSMLIPLLIAATMVVFFYGLFNYVRGGKKFAAQGKNTMIAGIVSLFVMVSIWGIITMAQGALGISGGAEPTLPAVPSAGY